MPKNYTYVLLELGYSFCDDYAPDGWEYFYEGDCEGWRSEENPDIEKDAKEIHEEYGGQFTVERTSPARVGSKASLLKYAKQFAYNYPEGTRIIQVQVEGEESKQLQSIKGQLREDFVSEKVEPSGDIAAGIREEPPFELEVSFTRYLGHYWRILQDKEIYQCSDNFDSEAEARIDGERQLKWLQENS